MKYGKRRSYQLGRLPEEVPFLGPSPQPPPSKRNEWEEKNCCRCALHHCHRLLCMQNTFSLSLLWKTLCANCCICCTLLFHIAFAVCKPKGTERDCFRSENKQSRNKEKNKTMRIRGETYATVMLRE